MSVSRADYGTSRGVGKLVAGIGWALVGLGGLILVVSVGSLSQSPFGLMGLIPAILVVVAGLMFVVQGQVLQATVDTAAACGSAASNLRELVRIASATTAAPEPTADGQQIHRGATPSTPPTSSADGVSAWVASRGTYRGHIYSVMSDGKVHTRTAAGLITFASVDELQSFFDRA